MGLLSGIWRVLAASPAPEPALAEAIVRAVDAVDPLLKTVSGHERRLAPAVSQALAHCEQLAAAVPGPVEIHPQAFASDPVVHSLFGAAQDIGDMLGCSRELRDFLADPARGTAGEFHALLGMRRREKVVSGMALNGGVLQQGVPQRLLYFADHTLGEIGDGHEDTRDRLKQAAFDSLARGFAACVADLRRQQLDARTALQIERARNGRSERRLELEERQKEAIASLAPERLLDAFADWLATPQRRVYLKPDEVRVDRMGVILPQGEAGGTALSLPELVGRDRRQWTVVLARFRREDALEAVRRRDEANRYLLIRTARRPQPPVSMLITSAPSATCWPSSTKISTTVPACGVWMSSATLPVSRVITLSSKFTVSPGLTRISQTVISPWAQLPQVSQQSG